MDIFKTMLGMYFPTFGFAFPSQASACLNIGKLERLPTTPLQDMLNSINYYYITTYDYRINQRSYAEFMTFYTESSSLTFLAPQGFTEFNSQNLIHRSIYTCY